MTAPPPRRERFDVGPDQMGPSAAAWAGSSRVRALDALSIPPCDHVVVVAPHPDDEVLGAGGLLQVLAARGARVELLAVSDGEASHGPTDPLTRAALARTRTDESLRALARLDLGVVRRVRAGVPDGDVAAGRDRVAAALEAQLRPGSVCVAPWPGDGHPDHEAAGQVAAEVSAARGAALLAYLVWAWHWAEPEGDELPWSACRRLDLSRRQLARKRWATGSFVSQTTVPDGAAGSMALLPPHVLRRSWQPWEVFVT